MSGEYFASSYDEARAKFRALASRREARMAHYTLAARGPDDQPLTIDTAWLGPAHAKSILLHVSGVHGVEGFMGSGVQCRLLEHPPGLRADQAILLVHCVNPFGMAWLRRVNENNVDLNRNFRRTAAEYRGAPPAYARMNAWLNGDHPRLRFDDFYVRAGWCVLRYGFRQFKQVIAGGQHAYPRGLFYGGERLEEGPRWLLEWLKEQLASASKIAVLDLHTGLGKFGRDMLMVPYEEHSAQWHQLRAQFGRHLVAPTAGGYRASGSFCEGVDYVAPHARRWLILQEFGTYLPMHVLRALRQENLLWWQGNRTELTHPLKRNLLEMFFPRQAAWRRAVLERGVTVVNEALQLLEEEGGT